MNKYPCELIEDLLPLYLEDDVSEKTKRIVEEHLDECPNCKRLVDEYRDTEPFLTDVEETLPQVDTFRKWMSRLKRSALFILMIFVIAGLSIGGISYYIGKGNGNNRHLLYAKEKEDIQEFFHEKTPGLKRAAEEGNVREINKTVKIPGDNDVLTVDSIWYTSRNIYVFFHIDGKIPTDTYGNLKWTNGEISTSFINGMNIGEGIIYKGTYYSRLSFGNMKEAEKPSEESMEEKLNLQITLRFGDLSKDEKQVKLPDMDFTVGFNPEKEETRQVDLKGSIELGQYGKLVFNQLIMEPQDSYLTFDYENEYGYQLQYMAGTLSTDKGDERKLWIPVMPAGRESPFYKLKFDALEAVPDSASITIEGMKLITGESVAFEIPVEKYHGKFQKPVRKEEVNRKIGNINNVELYLKRLWWNDRGLSFEVWRDVDLSADNPVDRISTSMITTVYEQARLNRDEYKNWLFPNVVTVMDENGRKADEKYYGQRGSGPDESINLEMEKEFVEASKSITVKIENLTYRAIGPWSGEIKVEK